MAMGKLIFCLIALAASVALALGERSCGQSAALDQSRRKLTRIVGGDLALPNAHPWIVSLQQNGGKHFCGGSLVPLGDHDETDIVVTAAHCLSVVRNRFTATVGKNDLYVDSVDEQTVQVQRTFYHSDFNASAYFNDIGIVKLATPIKFKSPAVQPVCLPESGEPVPPENTAGIVAGWGRTMENGSITPNLRQVAVPTITSEECATRLRVIPSTVICAGHRQGEMDSCRGDSGGPFVFASARGYTLQGVVSWGIGCARAGKPAVYSRVSYYRGWIEDQIKMHSSIAGTPGYVVDNYKSVDPDTSGGGYLYGWITYFFGH